MLNDKSTSNKYQFAFMRTFEECSHHHHCRLDTSFPSQIVITFAATSYNPIALFEFHSDNSSIIILYYSTFELQNVEFNQKWRHGNTKAIYILYLINFLINFMFAKHFILNCLKHTWADHCKCLLAFIAGVRLSEFLKDKKAS